MTIKPLRTIKTARPAAVDRQHILHAFDGDREAMPLVRQFSRALPDPAPKAA